MELDWVLLGLIRMHSGVTGYELNNILSNSTGYLMSTHLSRIYPALKRMRKKGLIEYQEVLLNNRPSKKVYHITPAGEEELQAWLKEPVPGIVDLQPFILKMSFSPLMDKATILKHIDSKMVELAEFPQENERGISLEMEYLDKDAFESQKAQVLWLGLSSLLIATRQTRLAQLKKWRQEIEKELE